MAKTGTQNPGRPVTLQNIADRCGVSRITASCALRGDRKNVSQAVMERIVETARAMGYDPSMATVARRLKYQHVPGQVENHLVALFFPVINDRYWVLIFQGINIVLRREGYGLLLCGEEEAHPALRETLPHVFGRGEVDGAMIAYSQGMGAISERLMGARGFDRRPIVTIAERSLQHASAIVDDRQVGHIAAAHLLDIGHRHLLCFHPTCFSQDSIRSERLKGLEEILQERGIDPLEHLHHAPWVWDDKRGLDAGLRDALNMYPMVTALIFPNDFVGIQAARALVKMGWRIPEDLSVVGVDDTEEWLTTDGRNMLTTVRLPLRKLGEESARLLLRRIRGEATESTVVTLPVELIVRSSTCAPKPA